VIDDASRWSQRFYEWIYFPDVVLVSVNNLSYKSENVVSISKKSKDESSLWSVFFFGWIIVIDRLFDWERQRGRDRFIVGLFLDDFDVWWRGRFEATTINYNSNKILIYKTL
jgi:hypothetical protein